LAAAHNERGAARSELAAARREHLELVARREGEQERERQRAAERAQERERAAERAQERGPAAERDRERPGDPDRSPALRHRPGWAWTQVVRRYDEYERVLDRLEAERTALQRSDEREPAPSR
jgi:chromosome segregation ATPase